MAMPYIDTPRTHVGDETRISLGDPDNYTENSIPSPTKEGNDLLRQIQAMRGPSLQTPRARAPFGNKRNVQKNEFTPLLKSAAANRFNRSAVFDQENSMIQIPAGLKNGYIPSSPALPLNSSIMREEYTGSPIGPDDGSATPQAPVPSSSAFSTPAARHARGGDGPLEHRGNLATLREQEAKLEQTDKENFGLKLKIHFLEEQMKRSGKEFNATALKENTELRVDKVTLQKDLRTNRKALDKAQADLESYKKQFEEYADKVKRRHMNESTKEELDQLRRDIAERDAKIELLEKSSTSSKAQDDERLQKLQDEVADLEAELRAKDMELDEKDDELERFQEKASTGVGAQQALDEKEQEIVAMQEQLKYAEEEIAATIKKHKLQLQTCQSEAESMADQLGDSRSKLAKAEDAASEAVSAQRRLEAAEFERSTSLRQQSNTVEKLESEIHSLLQKLQLAEGRDQDAEKLQDEIAGMRAEIREKTRAAKEAEDELVEVEDRLRDERNKAQDAMHYAEQRIKDLESQQVRNVRELQALRETGNQASQDRHEALEHANAQIADLENELDEKDIREQQVQNELKSLQAQVKNLNRQVEQERVDHQQIQAQVNDLNNRLEQEQGEHDQHEQKLQDRINKLEDEAEELIKKLDAKSTNEGKESKLQVETSELRRELQDTVSNLETLQEQYDDAQAQWDSQRKSLENQKTRAEEQASGLQRTVDALQTAKGSLSSRESQLQDALESERRRHKTEEASLQQELNDILQQLTSKQKETSNFKSELSTTQQELNIIKNELSSTRQDLQDSQDEGDVLQERIQALQDEVEVLQSSMDDDMDHLKEDLDTAEKERENLRKQVADIRAELESTKVTSRGSPSPGPTPIPQRELRQEVFSLREQLSALKKERQDLQRQLQRSERAQADALADFDTIQFDLRASTGTQGQLQQKMQDLRNQVNKAKEEKQCLLDNLADANLNLDTLRSSVADLESSGDAAQKRLREARNQLQTVQRDLDRKHQAQITTYEQDIANLEAEVSSATSKVDSLTKAKSTAEQKAAQLQTKVKQLEAQLENTTRQRLSPSHDPSASERHDLHEMLKDAKLEAEDLALQIAERDARIETASSKEHDLRTQLKRLRDERAEQAKRVINDSKDLAALQASHDRLTVKLAQTEIANRSVRMPKTSTTVLAASTSENLDKLTRRHTAELRGLVKQIEYLSARCKREEAFRRDLGYTKQYFMKQVEMYGKCTQADLRLVRAMGIPVDEVVLQQEEAMALEGRSEGVVVRGKGRTVAPTLKSVGLMVVAGLRMRRKMEAWGVVRSEHEGLLKKLKGMKRGISESQRRSVGA